MGTPISPCLAMHRTILRLKQTEGRLPLMPHGPGRRGSGQTYNPRA